jgi:hypothetical protein
MAVVEDVIVSGLILTRRRMPSGKTFLNRRKCREDKKMRMQNTCPGFHSLFTSFFSGCGGTERTLQRGESEEER